MTKFTIIPSEKKFKSAPSVDQKVPINLESTFKTSDEFDRIKIVNLNDVYNQERQLSNNFRPTFKVSFIYSNQYTGTTNYLPFKENLFYINQINSVGSGVWGGYPQFYEFDFYRPDTFDQHIQYVSKSAYTYNWGYYLSYPFRNNFSKTLSCNINSISINWIVQNGIPFGIKNIVSNGNKLVSFECVASHGLQIGESVELSFGYNGKKVFEVYSLGNNSYGSENTIFNIFDVGFTGTTFNNGTTGTFKRILDPENILETKSKYYIREHKIISNIEDCIISKTGFEKIPIKEETQLELSALTPNYVDRKSKKNNSYTYLINFQKDVEISDLLDNQKKPISELFLTIVNKGYSGYFNKPNNGVGIKQGWGFNISKNNNIYWEPTNLNSNSNILVNSYVNSGVTFFYNENLYSGLTIDGDFCEWNDFEQKERVISDYYQKIIYNQNIFTTSTSTNPNGFYYRPHTPIQIRVFSDYVETGSLTNIDQIPEYSYFSSQNKEFRWRDLYDYGFIDELGRGVDFPYLNNSHYPYKEFNFKLFPEGNIMNQILTGSTKSTKPITDGCE